MLRRLFLVATLSALLAACVSAPKVDPEVVRLLAPGGTLRVGVYPGSPTSLVVNATGQKAGVALELGQALGQRLGVPVQVMEFKRVAEVVDEIKAGRVDVTFTNATEARAKEVDFTPTLIRLELGYLVPPQSPIQDVSAVDRAGVRVGVTQGSSSQGVLGKAYRQAVVVPAASLKQAQQMFAQRQIDAFATNKGILFEMSDELPGYRVLDGRWGFEQLAMAIPKGRDAARPWLDGFARDMLASGQLGGMASRAGLRGMAKD